jgi:hypothetical protein
MYKELDLMAVAILQLNKEGKLKDWTRKELEELVGEQVR